MQGLSALARIAHLAGILTNLVTALLLANLETATADARLCNLRILRDLSYTLLSASWSAQRTGPSSP